jgi:hypothetical protein
MRRQHENDCYVCRKCRAQRGQQLLHMGCAAAHSRSSRAGGGRHAVGLRVACEPSPAKNDATALGSARVAPSESARDTLGVPNAFLGSATTNASSNPDT